MGLGPVEGFGAIGASPNAPRGFAGLFSSVKIRPFRSCLRGKGRGEPGRDFCLWGGKANNNKIITNLPGNSPASGRNEQESRRGSIRFLLFQLLFWRRFKNDHGRQGVPSRIHGAGGSGAGCGCCSPRARGSGLPGPFQPLPGPPARAGVGGGKGTAQEGLGRSPPSEQFIPGSIPLQKLSPRKTVRRVFARARRGYPVEKRKGMRWLLTGLLDFEGDWQEERGPAKPRPGCKCAFGSFGAAVLKPGSWKKKYSPKRTRGSGHRGGILL